MPHATASTLDPSTELSLEKLLDITKKLNRLYPKPDWNGLAKKWGVDPTTEMVIISSTLAQDSELKLPAWIKTSPLLGRDQMVVLPSILWVTDTTTRVK